MKAINLIVFLLIPFFSWSQYTVKGKVTDNSGEPLIGATVMVKGTSIGTITDLDGQFTLTGLRYTSTLVIQYVGYETKEVSVTSSTYYVDVKLSGKSGVSNALTKISGNKFYFGFRVGGITNFGKHDKNNFQNSIWTPEGEQFTTLIPKNNTRWVYKPWKLLFPEPWFKVGKGNTGNCNCNYKTISRQFAFYINYDFSYKMGITTGLSFQDYKMKQFYFTDLSSYPSYLVETNVSSTGFPVYLKYGNLNMQTYGYIGFQYNTNKAFLKSQFIGGEVFEEDLTSSSEFKKHNLLWIMGMQLGVIHFELGFTSPFTSRNFQNSNGFMPYSEQRSVKTYFNVGFTTHLKKSFVSTISNLMDTQPDKIKGSKSNSKRYPDKYGEVGFSSYFSTNQDVPENCDKIVITTPFLNVLSYYNIDWRYFGFAFGLEHSNYGIRSAYDPFSPDGFLDQNRVLALGFPIFIKLGPFYFGGNYFWNYYHTRKQTFVLDEGFEKYADFNSDQVQKFSQVIFGGVRLGNWGVELDYMPDNFLNTEYKDPKGYKPYEMQGALYFIKIKYLLRYEFE